MCSRTAVNALFSGGNSVIAYPLRAVFRFIDCDSTVPPRFLITIPKKKIRTAVGRVLMRRRVREAYRLRRFSLAAKLADCGKTAEIAFLYLDSRLIDYNVIDERMTALLDKIADRLTASDADTSATDSPR